MNQSMLCFAPTLIAALALTTCGAESDPVSTSDPSDPSDTADAGDTTDAAGTGGTTDTSGTGGTTGTTATGGTTDTTGTGGATDTTGTGGATDPAGTAGTTDTTGTGGAPESGPPLVVTPPADAVFTDDFETGAGNWNVTQGYWTPTADVTTVLTSSNEGNEARALAGDMSWTDMTVSGSVKILNMDEGRRIYLAARYIDSNNWYGAALHNSGDREAQIRKKVLGASSDIAAVPFQFEFNTWYRIEFSIAGSELSMRIDGVPMTTGTDTEFAAGGIAVLADRSEVSWDDIHVTIP
jgi:hypothetical protein